MVSVFLFHGLCVLGFGASGCRFWGPGFGFGALGLWMAGERLSAVEI